MIELNVFVLNVTETLLTSVVVSPDNFKHQISREISPISSRVFSFCCTTLIYKNWACVPPLCAINFFRIKLR